MPIIDQYFEEESRILWISWLYKLLNLIIIHHSHFLINCLFAQFPVNSFICLGPHEVTPHDSHQQGIWIWRPHFSQQIAEYFQQWLFDPGISYRVVSCDKQGQTGSEEYPEWTRFHLGKSSRSHHKTLSWVTSQSSARGTLTAVYWKHLQPSCTVRLLVFRNRWWPQLYKEEREHHSPLNRQDHWNFHDSQSEYYSAI